MRVLRKEQAPLVDRLSDPPGTGAQEEAPLDSGNDEEERHKLSADVMVTVAQNASRPSLICAGTV